jgi:hypothetical protein
MNVETIADLIGNAIIYWIFQLFESNYLEKRNSYKIGVWVTMIVFLTIYCFLTPSENTEINLFWLVFIYYISAIVCYKETLLKTLAFTLVFTSIFTAVEGSIMALYVTHFASLAMANDLITINIFWLCIYLFMFLVVFLLKHLHKDKSSIHDPITLIFICCYSLLLSVAVGRIIAVMYSDTPYSNFVLFLFFLLAVLFSNGLLFLLYNNFYRRKGLEIDLKINKEREENRDILFRQYEQNMEEKNQIIHDYKNHILHIQQVIDTPKIARIYCEELIGKYSIHLDYYRFNMENEILNTILGKLKYDCDQSGIQLDLQILYQNFSFISPADTSSLFGNLFDNALNACRTLPENKWIYVMISRKNDLIHISVSNSKSNEVKMHKHTILSTRRQYAKKGHGIDIIKAIVTKFQGDMSITYNSNDFTCTCWITTVFTKT